MKTPKTKKTRENIRKQDEDKRSPDDLDFKVKYYFLKLDSRGDQYADGDNVRYQYPTISLSEDPTDATLPTAIVYFYPDGYKLPAANRSAGIEIYLHFHISEFPRVMEILRTPGPVVCAYRVQSNLVWAHLQGPSVRRNFAGK
jgi:hypothetical protein